VHQGDPISPLLFGIVEDFLSRLLSRMVDFSQLLPISSPREFSAPTHLLYSEDVLIFYRGTVQNLKNIVSVFEVFERRLNRFRLLGIVVISILGSIGLLYLKLQIHWYELILEMEDLLCRAGLHLASQCIVCGVFSALQWRISTDTWSSFFSQAMLVLFSDQVRVLWKTTIHVMVWSVLLACNQWIFKSKAIDFRSALSLVWRAVSDANRLEIGCMRNCIDDLLILCRFDLRGRPARAPIIRSVIWSPLAPDWTKVNTDGAALSSPGVGGCGGVFHNCRAFVKGCFDVYLDHVFVFLLIMCFLCFEAEFLVASMAIYFARQNGWHQIWFESDSSYVVQLLSSHSDQVLWRIRQA
ncbi:hypothetical protein Ddye_021363, partial [Dipteronia dyeriana]